MSLDDGKDILLTLSPTVVRKLEDLALENMLAPQDDDYDPDYDDRDDYSSDGWMEAQSDCNPCKG